MSDEAMSNEQLPDIRRHPDGRWAICWEPDQHHQHWRFFEVGTFSGALFGDLPETWRPVAVLDLPAPSDADLPTLMDSVVQVEGETNYGIGLAIWHPGTMGGATTRLSIGQARAVAAQLLANADAYERDSAQEGGVVR